MNDRERHELRLDIARRNPNRRNLAKFEHELLDERLESPLGRLAFKGVITPDQYEAGKSWREAYLNYLICIGAPSPFPDTMPLESTGSMFAGPQSPASDLLCERWTNKFNHGKSILMACGKRVFHSVNSIAVYEQPEELGDQEFTIAAAKIGLTALASGKAEI